MEDSARQRRTRILTVALIISAVPVLFLVVTSFTGFPGPGPLRRYPLRDLQAVVDRLNDSGDQVGNCPKSALSGLPPPQRASLNPISGRIEDGVVYSASSRGDPGWRPTKDELAMFDPPPTRAEVDCLASR